ncbi:hypothetical protein EJB05_35306, partial [Eragrostis curvula]
MKRHVNVKLLDGGLPSCPQDRCATRLTLKGSRKLLSPQLLRIMEDRVRERLIPPDQKVYCPYPRCSALMSTSELPAFSMTQDFSEETVDGGLALATKSYWCRGRELYFQCLKKIHASSSFAKYALGDMAMRRKCVRCRGSFCLGCKVPWHDGMTCSDFRSKYPDPRPDGAKLQSLARQRLWRQCVRCKHVIELAAGCHHMTCVCGYEFCYKCGNQRNVQWSKMLMRAVGGT